MSVSALKSGRSMMSVLKSVLAGIGQVFSSFAAAAAVSSALENRRQPDEADLAVLGLEGVRFKQYY